MKSKIVHRLWSKNQLAAVVVIALIGTVTMSATRRPRRELGTSVDVYPIRNSPNGVRPILPRSTEESGTIEFTDEEVGDCFRRLLPPDDLSRSGTLHALRLWGLTSATSKWSGELAVAQLLNVTAVSSWSEPVVNGYGAFILTSADESARRSVGAENLDPHRNKTLSVLGLCGVDTSTDLRVANKSYTVRDLIRGAMNESRTQHGAELPWTIVGLASYLGSARPWSNRHGENISVEGLVLALLETPADTAPCLGTHGPYAAAFVLRIHQQTPLLSPTGEALIRKNLQRTTESLRLRQRPSGSWGKDWRLESAGIPGVIDVPVEVLVTGHHLEWLSLLPADLSPHPAMLRQAERFLISAILNASESDIAKNYTVYSHAGCALRNRFSFVWHSTRDDLRNRSDR